MSAQRNPLAQFFDFNPFNHTLVTDPFEELYRHMSSNQEKCPFRLTSCENKEEQSENSLAQWTARSELKELDDHYEMVLAMPGVPKENVEVSVHNNTLTVSGKTTQESEGDENGTHWSKMMRSSYKRSFALPEGTTGEHLSATMENGVLHLNIQKNSSTKPEPYKVTVQ